MQKCLFCILIYIYVQFNECSPLCKSFPEFREKIIYWIEVMNWSAFSYRFKIIGLISFFRPILNWSFEKLYSLTCIQLHSFIHFKINIFRSFSKHFMDVHRIYKSISWFLRYTIPAKNYLSLQTNETFSNQLAECLLEMNFSYKCIGPEWDGKVICWYFCVLVFESLRFILKV